MTSDKHAAAIEAIKEDWHENPRWRDVKRDYTAEDVFRLRGSLVVEHTLAHRGADKLWRLLTTTPYVNTLGALTGNQAMQQVKAGLKAIYLSGWQVAADGNDSCQMYPDQSLYSVSSVPSVVRRINNALMRADQLHHAEGDDSVDWFAPIVADAESGFGGVLNAYELMKAMIEAGAAGVHFEDQLSSVKKCGHMGGKVLVLHAGSGAKTLRRTARGGRHGRAHRAACAHGRRSRHARHQRRRRERQAVPDRRALGRRLLPGAETASSRRFRADLPTRRTPTWCGARPARPISPSRANTPRRFTASIPDKMLAYNCSPSFNWKRHLDNATIAKFQRELGAMGYKFQFITLAGFHMLNYGMFDLARRYATEGMAAYAPLQEAEFAAEKLGYTATKHQREVGTGYFDAVTQVIQGGKSSVTALTGSTEEAQFHDAHAQSRRRGLICGPSPALSTAVLSSGGRAFSGTRISLEMDAPDLSSPTKEFFA